MFVKLVNVLWSRLYRSLIQYILLKESKSIGLSECSAETFRRAYKVHPIAAVQSLNSWNYGNCRELASTLIISQEDNIVAIPELAHALLNE
ncbi:unnamed protein product [Rhizophagus irregularis]|nr:unnamed protein product [Rhizophagus irregularis]